MTISVENTSTGTWDVVDSGVFLPSWIASILQFDNGASPWTYSYSLDLQMALSGTMPSFRVKNHVTNAYGGP